MKVTAVGVAVLSTAVIVAGCGDSPSAQAPKGVAAVAPAANVSQAATLEVVRVVEQPVNVTLSMPGELEPYQAVAIFPKVSGFVKTVGVDRGSRVRTWQVLATLEAPELTAQRAEAQSKVQAAEAQLAAVRAKADSDASTFEKLKAASATPGVVAGNDLVVAQKTLESDQSQVAAAQQNVEAAKQAVQAIAEMEGYLRVTAPFDGVITERNVHPGALVGPGGAASAAMPMLRLVDTRRLRLVVPVSEAYIGGIAAGTEMAFSVPAYPGEKFSGKVARIAQAIDVKTRTMAIELDVMNADGRLAPGTFCQVPWPVRRHGPSLFVPSGSVASTTDRTFVVRVRNGRTEWVDVKTGLAAGPLVEVFGDLKPGEEVASRGTDEIKPGAEVKAKTAKPGA
jgi:membrane fusion protein (multidrug efflux system)